MCSEAVEQVSIGRCMNRGPECLLSLVRRVSLRSRPARPTVIDRSTRIQKDDVNFVRWTPIRSDRHMRLWARGGCPARTRDAWNRGYDWRVGPCSFFGHAPNNLPRQFVVAGGRPSADSGSQNSRRRIFDALFDTTRDIPWGRFLPPDARFPVTGRSIKSTLTSVPACQRAVKRAVVDALSRDHSTERTSRSRCGIQDRRSAAERHRNLDHRYHRAQPASPRVPHAYL